MFRRGKFRSSSSALEENLINLTPLIDVVFVILIVFILVAPMLDTDQIELPGSGAATKTISGHESIPVKIMVNQKDEITLNGQRVTLRELKHRMRDLYLEHPNEKPHLFQDRKAHFGIYQEVKNSVEESGFSQMEVVLKKE
ncbi:MAG: biopolymer transporter ExbD [Candidatus Algichlamydia australiensis]|nr:biopolymer transporter ExbD [Chlamydiales bacterium]